MKHLLITAAIAVSMATSALASSLTDTYTSFVVFGDSLSDNGNLFGTTGQPPAPFFINGRFSNGPVWNEAIAAEFPNGDQPGPALGGTGSNLAFGGARADNDPNANGPIPSLQTQIGIHFATRGTFTPGTLVSVWAGANDIFQDLSFGNGETVGADAAFAVGESLAMVIGLGAQTVLSFNLPDLGVTPGYSGTALAADATDASEKFNEDLANEIALLRLVSPQTNFIEVDVFSIFNDIIDDPSAFGLSNVTDQCQTTAACFGGSDAAQDAFLFWDDVHPTRTGHRLIEAAARQALTPVPLPAGAPLYLVGMLGFGMIARRR